MAENEHKDATSSRYFKLRPEYPADERRRHEPLSRRLESGWGVTRVQDRYRTDENEGK